MPREATGRNDPCPCGSGKKYKKCCWEKDQAEQHSRATEEAVAEAVASEHEIDAELDQLDAWMREACHAVHHANFERAEELHVLIRERFPDWVDAPYLLAQLRAAQGRWPEAVAAFEEAIRILEADRHWFDQEFLDDLRHGLDKARRCAAPADDSRSGAPLS